MAEDYKKLVKAETRRGFWEHFENRRKLAEPILVTILSVIIYLLVSYVINGKLSRNEILIAIIPTVGVPLLWVAAVWYMNRAKSHERLFRRVEAEANKPKWVDVPIDIPLSFKVNPHGACLMITNHKKVKVQKAAVRLTRVIEGNLAIREDVLENSEIWIPRSKGGVFYPRGTLDEEGTGVYSVAHWNNNEAWINTMDNHSVSEKIPLKEDVPYIVMLKFIGHVEGKPMDENQRRYAVRYVNQRVELSELV